MKFDLLSTVQLFRKLTRDVRSYVQKVSLPYNLAFLLGEHAFEMSFMLQYIFTFVSLH